MFCFYFLLHHCYGFFRSVATSCFCCNTVATLAATSRQHIRGTLSGWEVAGGVAVVNAAGRMWSVAGADLRGGKSSAQWSIWGLSHQGQGASHLSG